MKTLHPDFKALLHPIEELPEGQPNQCILVVESEPQSCCGFVVERYHYERDLPPKCKGWKGDPFVLFHSMRGDQKSRIVGWLWVVK